MIRHILVSRVGEVIGRDWCGGMLKLSELSEPAQASTSGIAESKEVNQGEQIAE